MLVGRTKFCEKGVFSCNIENDKKERVYIFSTHLQHSEECDFPTDEEKVARMRQMELIQKKVDAVKDRGLVVLTGDMNCDDAEFDRSIWKNSKRVRFLDSKTWGGDQFCAELVKKRISGPLNLDYTCIADGPFQGDIQTTLIKTGFSGAEFRKEAFSDHEAL
jgi:endonuclease/exonuclease/phosphatase family metal-dependent hydrolase